MLTHFGLQHLMYDCYEDNYSFNGGDKTHLTSDFAKWEKKTKQKPGWCPSVRSFCEIDPAYQYLHFCSFIKDPNNVGHALDDEEIMDADKEYIDDGDDYFLPGDPNAF